LGWGQRHFSIFSKAMSSGEMRGGAAMPRTRSMPSYQLWQRPAEWAGTTTVTKVAAIAETLPDTAKKMAIGRRLWALLLLLCMVLLGFERRMVGVHQDVEQLQRLFASEQVDETLLVMTNESERTFLKVGSLYQNDYMTLWNANEVPISVTLNIEERNSFVLRVEHLNSKGGGNAGWIGVKGTFDMRAMENAGGRFALTPGPGSGDLVFVYDASLLDRPMAFLYRCLERLGAHGILSAIRLEVDPEQDAVLVTPTARIVKALWDEAVVLRLTREDLIWKYQQEQD